MPKLHFAVALRIVKQIFLGKTWQCVDAQLIEVNKSAGKFKKFSHEKIEKIVQF